MVRMRVLNLNYIICGVTSPCKILLVSFDHQEVAISRNYFMKSEPSLRYFTITLMQFDSPTVDSLCHSIYRKDVGLHPYIYNSTYR